MACILIHFFSKIDIDNRRKGDTGEDTMLSVDGVDFMIREPYPYVKDVSNIWYSKKINGPGLRYEFAVSIKTGDLCWINGPYPCGEKNDLGIFRAGLMTFLDENERVECDDGYQGEDPLICKTRKGISSLYSSDEEKAFQNTVRARQETAHKRFKQFGALNGIFRHALEKHSDFVYAAATISQIVFEMGEPLFQIDSDLHSRTHLEIVQELHT